MGFINTYKYDIFISYSHLDNKKQIYDKNFGWVDIFHRQLQIYLDSQFGDTIKIWRDERLDGNEQFDDSIKEKIESTAIFLSLVSKGYLNSDYCLKELELFYNYSLNQPASYCVKNRNRSFKILLANIDHSSFKETNVNDSLSKLIGKTIGFKFNNSTQNDEIGFPIEPNSNEFKVQIQKLSSAIYKTLYAIKQNNVKSINNHRTFTEYKQAEPDLNYPVFFADVEDSIGFIKKRITEELIAEGIYVSDKIPPPYDPIEKHDQEVSKIVRQSKLTIHMLGNCPGRQIALNKASFKHFSNIQKDQSDLQTYPMRQLHICLDESVKKIIWSPEINVNKGYESYKLFRDSLYLLENNIEIYTGTQQELKRDILDEINLLKNSNKSLNNHNQQPSVLLDAHRNDFKYGFDVSKIFINNNIQLLINHTDEDIGKMRLKQLENLLASVDSLIFVYGNATRKWILSRLYSALGIIYANKLIMKYIAVVIVPSNTEKIEDFRQKLPGDVHLIDNREQNNLESAILKHFDEIHKLR